MPRRFDEEGFRDPAVKELTELVMDMINGPNQDHLYRRSRPETMRVAIEVPKAWILFAAWQARSRRNLSTNTLELWPFQDIDLSDEASWQEMHHDAQRYLAFVLEGALSAQLDDVEKGRDRLFWDENDRLLWADAPGTDAGT